MKTDFTTIELSTLDTVTGGASPKTELIKRGGKWAWDNVVKPAGIGAAMDWAADKWSQWRSGGQQQQPAPAPQQNGQ